MIYQIANYLYCIEITLPNNPLRSLNSYVFKDPSNGRSLLIDTGFNLESCREELLEGMRELNLPPEATDVLISHAHSDHSGNGSFLSEKGYRILISEKDYDLLNNVSWQDRTATMIKEGTPPNVINEVMAYNPAILYSTGYFPAEFIHDSDVLSYAGYNLKVILTPGHTPGQICLYDDGNSLFYSADHILFDITPNITSRGEGTNALGDYFKSLKNVKSINADIVLPSHRSAGNKQISQRVDEIIVHHNRRLQESYDIICSNPGINAYDFAGKLKWNIKSQSWESFPPSQKWFAVSEALAHLDYLQNSNMIYKEFNCFTGYYQYYKK